MRLSITGAESPELALRVLNLLAQQGVVVERALIERDDGGCRMLLDTIPVAMALAERIVDKLRSMVLVSAVERLDESAA
ncbi:hypothetical protein [Sphingomonas sp. LT1P40]|uniref:hypothetical protein n=1 Tax=Alteristakelama amylovorans TaxID=3096166 RepID=UPI002FC939ED